MRERWGAEGRDRKRAGEESVERGERERARARAHGEESMEKGQRIYSIIHSYGMSLPLKI